jgi:hypothetical protein
LVTIPVDDVEPARLVESHVDRRVEVSLAEPHPERVAVFVEPDRVGRLFSIPHHGHDVSRAGRGVWLVRAAGHAAEQQQ